MTRCRRKWKNPQNPKNDLRFPFLVYILSIPLAGILCFWFRFPDKRELISIGRYLKPLMEAGKERGVQAVLIFNFLSFFLLYTVVTFIPQHLASQLGISEGLMGVFLAVQAVATITLAMQSGKFVELVRKKYLIGSGFLISGLGFIKLTF